ncbi:plasmid mobilization protein [Echinicola soli]|nr:plasmid mobilization relaxosome protein MobC [Echinicola soli]
MTKQSKRRNLTKLVESRISVEQYQQLVDTLAKSQNPTMSSLIRDILSRKTIVCKTHDETYDLLLDRMQAIQMEIHAIGVNINQVTRYFNSLKDPLRKKSLVKKLEKQLVQTGKKVDHLEMEIKRHFPKW